MPNKSYICYSMLGRGFRMSVIKHILEEELKRLQSLEIKYRSELEKLPKGSISIKQRNKGAYFYWAYRNKEKIKFKYIGKEEPNEALNAIEQRAQRIKYAELLKKVQNDIKEIQRSVNGKR